jgi:anion-transporting  ArsA/GET3 family ATPase
VAFDQKSQKIYMVTGKGGVGKSVVAAVLAKQLAKQGFRTLLVELGDHSYYQHIFTQKVEYHPTALASNLDVALWSGEACLREYVQYLLKIEALVHLFFDNKVMRTFVRAAPALKELAILGKVTSGIRKWGPPLTYDRIVVDAFATGHFLALLRAPVGMGELIATGPMGEQSRSIQRVLSNPEITEYQVVTLLEELPISETLELCAELKKDFNVTPKIVANKYFALDGPLPANLPQDFSPVVNYLAGLAQRSATGLEQLKTAKLPIDVKPIIFSPHNLQIIDRLT